MPGDESMPSGGRDEPLEGSVSQASASSSVSDERASRSGSAAVVGSHASLLMGRPRPDTDSESDEVSACEFLADSCVLYCLTSLWHSLLYRNALLLMMRPRPCGPLSLFHCRRMQATLRVTYWSLSVLP